MIGRSDGETPVLPAPDDPPDVVWERALAHAFDPWVEPLSALVPKPAAPLVSPQSDDDAPADATDDAFSGDRTGSDPPDDQHLDHHYLDDRYLDHGTGPGDDSG